MEIFIIAIFGVCVCLLVNLGHHMALYNGPIQLPYLASDLRPVASRSCKKVELGLPHTNYL